MLKDCSTDVQMYIIVIDGRDPVVARRARTAVEELERVGGYSQEDYTFAKASQEVLIHGYIDQQAILGVVPWHLMQHVLPPEYLSTAFSKVTSQSSATSTSPYRDYAWNLAAQLYQK